MTEKKEKQIRKEAKATVACVIAIIIYWLIAGFGLSNLSITIFYLPLWVVTGCFGTWIFAMILVWFLITKVFKDMDLEEDEDE